MKSDINNHLNIGELPDLKIVPIDQIVFHEEPDQERSTSLQVFLQKEGKLKNPPIVAYHQHNTQYILLDGANRITALRNLNIKDVLVQSVDIFDPDLLLLHWHHAVEKFSKQEFLNKLYAIEGITVEESSQEEIPCQEHKNTLCQIQFFDVTVYRVLTNAAISFNVDLLNKITNIYNGFAYMDRVSYTNLAHLKKHYSNFCALVCFKKILKEDLIDIVKHGKKMPSGITRIILPKRALRLNVPLDILRFEAPVVEKNHWLQERIELQVKDKSIRFYYEPTFLFDE